MNLLKKAVLLLFYGRFSHTFHKHHHRDGKLSKNHKRYLRSCSRNDALTHYRKCTEDRHGEATFSSDAKLQFRLIEFGASFQKVRAKHPDYKCFDVDEYFGQIWKRLGYKERIRKEGVKCTFHFLNEEFFFGELLYADSRKIDLDQIAGALVKKYTGERYEYDQGDIKIQLKNGFIYLENSGLHVSIKYISTMSQEINDLLALITVKKGDNLEPTS